MQARTDSTEGRNVICISSEQRNTFRQSSRKPAVSDLYEAAVPLEQVDCDGSITHRSLFLLSTVGDTAEWAELNSLQSNDWSTSTLVGHAMNLVDRTTTIISKLLQTYCAEAHC